MKRTTIHISAALALLLGLAACTQDEAGFLPEGAEGTPIVFTVTGLNPAVTATAGTRAPVDGNWEGVTSVAVRMDGTVKAYDVTPTTADHTSATLTSDEPYYWTNHDDITVTAWWPYTAGETTPPAVKVAANQSARKDFEGSDLIVAEEQTVSYGNTTLRFTHRTARVTVVLTDYTEERMFVRLTGLSTADGNPAQITPYNKGGDTYTALVAPQTVAAGTAFITCKFTNGKVFVYKMKNDTDWQAGEEYTYTVSLAAADPGYTVSEDGKTYTVTTAEGLKAVADIANNGNLGINITLTENINLTDIDWTPIGTDYYNQYTGAFDGGNHTITGLTVTGSNEFAGLFGFIGPGGTVQNVVLEGVQITSDNSLGYVGGVAGYCYGGTLENCSVSGSISGTLFVGGVVSNQIGGSITGCSSSATVKGVIFVGGIAGETNDVALLTGCYATGDVTVENDGPSQARAGGVVGSNGGNSTLTACYAAGNVSGKGSGTIHVGGAVGENYGTLTACYWSGLPDNDNGGATKVDGTTVTWTDAVTAMNAALSGKGWQYELKDGNSLPTYLEEGTVNRRAGKIPPVTERFRKPEDP